MKLAKFSNLHIYFFYLFLFSIPLQTRKVFLTEYSFYSGAFTEYATFFIYASDILLIFALFFWLVFSKKLHERFNVKNLANVHELPVVWLLLLAFIVWLIISAIINNNYTEISVFYILKFIELSLLIIYIYFNLRNKKRLITAFFVISLAGFFQGLIAIYQFAYQCPLFKHPFLHKLTGESTVYPHLPGIAKMVMDNEKFIRAYGTFPHPNLLGGFLILSISISIYLLLKHKSYILSRLSFKYNNINTNKSQVRAPSLLLSLFWIILIFTQITALLFTFSRTAWMGFLIFLFLMGVFYIYHFLIVSRETIRSVETNKVTRNTSNCRIAKFVIVSLSNYDKFSVLPTLRQAQDDILKFINNKLLKRKLDKKIVSRETIEMRDCDMSSWSRNNFSNFHNVSRETISENLNDKKSVSLTNNTDSSVSTRKQSCYYRLFYRFKELIIIVLLTLILIIIYFPHINSRINEELSINSSLSSSYLPSNYAFDDRIFYNNVSRETISENSTFGSGPGTFIFQINSYLAKNNIYQKLEPWQYQPAHNVYLLIISEIGIVGFIILSLFIMKIMICNYKIIKKPLNKSFYLNNNSNNTSIVSRETVGKNKTVENKNVFYIFKKIIRKILFTETSWIPASAGMTESKDIIARRGFLNKLKNRLNNNKLNNKIVSRETISVNLNRELNYYLLAILVSFLFIELFDHYFWTLQQGKLMFWLVLGLILVNGKNKNKIDI